MVSFGSFSASAVKWIRKLASLGLAGASIVAIDSLQEYAIGILLLVLAFIGFTVQIHDWKGVEGKRVVTRISKAVLWATTALILILLAAVYVKLKGQKPWSNIEMADRFVVAFISAMSSLYNVTPWRYVFTVITTGLLTWAIFLVWYRRDNTNRLLKN